MPFNMNQQLDMQRFCLAPDSRDSARDVTLSRLLVPGDIMDSCLDDRCRRLQELFDNFVSTCPAPEWQAGLVITSETRCQTEKYLPLADIQSAFRCLLERAFHYQPFLRSAPIFYSLSWIDALERILPFRLELNPAGVIYRAAREQTFRFELLAALFTPVRYGGSHNRYPLQKGFLLQWLSGHCCTQVRLLDAACGTGEGVYEYAEMACDNGIEASIHGCTVEPLELAAAAHGWFPTDSEKSAATKMLIKRFSGISRIEFFRDDICSHSVSSETYDIVVCNGLLGGPLLHSIAGLDAAVGWLAKKVKKEGLILAANRFHDGWQRIIPSSYLEMLLAAKGFRVISVPEGVGAIRTG